jgi:hypothetical protein
MTIKWTHIGLFLFCLAVQVYTATSDEYAIDYIDTTIGINVNEYDECLTKITHQIKLTFANMTERSQFSIPLFNTLTAKDIPVEIVNPSASSQTSYVDLFNLSIGSNIQGTATIVSLDFGFNINGTSIDNSTLYGNVSTSNGTVVDYSNQTYPVQLQITYYVQGIFRAPSSQVNMLQWSITNTKPINFTRVTVIISNEWALKYTPSMMTATPDASYLSSGKVIFEKTLSYASYLYEISVTIPRQSYCYRNDGNSVVGVIVVVVVILVIATGCGVCITALVIHLILQKQKKKQLLMVKPNTGHLLQIGETTYSQYPADGQSPSNCAPPQQYIPKQYPQQQGFPMQYPDRQTPMQYHQESKHQPTRYNVHEYTPGADQELRY